MRKSECVVSAIATDNMKLAIDFDGTICQHRFPEIGEPVPGAVEWLLKFQEAGALLILWTMRGMSHQHGDVLKPALDFCNQQGIVFAGINKGINDELWTISPKAYAHIYIDDAAFGCPLVYPSNGRPYVDWAQVGPTVLNMIDAYREAA